MISQAELKEILLYDPDTGVFTWLQKISDKTVIGEMAGSLKPHGYILIGIKGKRYCAHRLAFVYMTGSCSKTVDHRNNVRHDNRWSNLRDDDGKNSVNKIRQSNNKSGYKGVCLISRPGKTPRWRAVIQLEGKYEHLGTFYNPEEAYAVYCARAKILHGEFANFG